ncbi:MAG: hypothetical protein VCF24_13105 [Candidatus Latescibacterota bacterium]
MKRAVILCLGFAGAVSGLERSTPEEQGISSTAILAFVDAAENEVDVLHSLCSCATVTSLPRVGGRRVMPTSPAVSTL